MLVRVVEYDPHWPQMFEREAEKLAAVLGDNLVAIHHIGSTAVEGLAAKPIIDILPVVKNLAYVDAKNEQFAALGYECMGEFGIPGRRYMRKGGDLRTHQVHVFAQENEYAISRHLAVRDYLRAHPAEAAEYAALKRSLAARYPSDIEGYCDGKDAFVKQLEKRALLWKQKT